MTQNNSRYAEAIPLSALSEINEMLENGELFRYARSADSSVSRLEKEFATRMGTRFALAVSSCSSALFLSLRALELPENAKVLIPAFTFAAVPSAIVHAGYEPVLCEVGDNLRIINNDFQMKLHGVDAVMISHMRGHTSDMDFILSECARLDIPVIEDAAHSMGATWRGKQIGTLSKAGCFSFQSHKMLNCGEGGMLVSDDPDLIAKAIIMSGAYEQNWKKHPALEANFSDWQNKLPLYNVRMSNFSAALVRSQLDQIQKRSSEGLSNYEYVAAMLAKSPNISIPTALQHEKRAPDSIQFLLENLTEDQSALFVSEASKHGISVQIFGLLEDNARAYWNWHFLKDIPDLPETAAMLKRVCDVKLPAWLKLQELDFVANGLVTAISKASGSQPSTKSRELA